MILRRRFAQFGNKLRHFGNEPNRCDKFNNRFSTTVATIILNFNFFPLAGAIASVRSKSDAGYVIWEEELLPIVGSRVDELLDCTDEGHHLQATFRIVWKSQRRESVNNRVRWLKFKLITFVNSSVRDIVRWIFDYIAA